MWTFRYLLFVIQTIYVLYSVHLSYGLSKYEKSDLESLREEVREMFQHAYDSYLTYAFPYDELRPLSCDGVDTWGSYSLTLIDALDTLAVMGNYTEFQRVINIVTANANFDSNINVSVFETNIRIIGGLLSAHLLSHRAGVDVVPGWPCNGPLLQLAEDVARRLIAAFDTPTGMPYGTVNLRYGVPEGETTVTCTAGVGTFILELGTLSRLTGDPLFEEVAMNALDALHHHRSPIGLVGNHIDVATGRWTAQDAGIGAGVDSYYEYLAKGAILLQRPELMHMFDHGKAAIEKYLKRDDWHLWVSMTKGQVTLPVFQSLEAYWPGVLSLVGDINKGMKSLHNYHQVWKQYGFTPEFYYIPQSEVGVNRESYPLRPELIESVMYLYRATGDPYLIDVGRDILRSIQHSAKTPCGYATIKDVRDHRKEDRMESFFLAETTKYLYLLFDPDNFIHNRGQTGTVVKTPWGECVLEAGGYIFNTEAHPIDPAALHCCSGPRNDDMNDALFGRGNSQLFQGDPLSKVQDPKKTVRKSNRKTVNKNVTPVDEKVSDQANTLLLNRISNKLTKQETGAEDHDKEIAENLDMYLQKLVSDLDGIITIEQLRKLQEPVGKTDEGKGTLNEVLTKDTSVDENDKIVKEEQLMLENTEEILKKEMLRLANVKSGLKLQNRRSELEKNKSKRRKVTLDVSPEQRAKWLDENKEINTIHLDYHKESKSNVNQEKIKNDMLDYQVDDSEPATSVSSSRVNELDCTDEWTSQSNARLPEFVRQYLLAVTSTKPKFDPQVLYQRLGREMKYPRNAVWMKDFAQLSCPAQPFLQRISLSGEMFG